MLHRRQGTSAKLAQCDHLTYRVWTQYLLSSDDCGVMVDEAAKIRGDNLALLRESEEEIRKALDLLLSLGLVVRFEHQGQRYLCSLDWQDHQGVAYPRKRYLPVPPPDVLAQCSPKTRELFDKSSKAKEGDGYRHTLTANGLSVRSSEGESEGEPPMRGGCLHGGSHRSHASCGRVCVPDFLHTEFLTLIGGDEDKADLELRAHYRRWWAALAPNAVVTEPLRWLRARFAETYADKAAPLKPDKSSLRKASKAAFLNRHAKES
jgi:hypothetical protein